MTSRTSWTLIQIANSAVFAAMVICVDGWAALWAAVPLVFALTAAGFLYNKGAGVPGQGQ